MDLGLNEIQQMLKTSAKEFLDSEFPDTYVREMEEDSKGYTDEIWQKIAEQGWIGLIIPEEYGGAGLEFQDLIILLEEMGRYMLPGPYFTTVVLGGMTLMKSATEEQKKEYLPRIAEGQIIVTLALTEPDASWEASGVQLEATDTNNGYILNGTKLFVPYANVSEYFIVAARTGKKDTDISLFMVSASESGISQTSLKTIGSDNQSEVVFKNVAVSHESLLGDLNKGWDTIKQITNLAAIGKCAEMSGAIQNVLEMTVEYAKQRTQFGRPIGTFQAVQHHCANMATEVELSRLMTYQAGSALSEGLSADKEVAMAKAWVNESAKRVCAMGHQTHGAIGFTKEHNLQLYTKRIKSAELMFGDAQFHTNKIADLLNI